MQEHLRGLERRLGGFSQLQTPITEYIPAHTTNTFSLRFLQRLDLVSICFFILFGGHGINRSVVRALLGSI